MNYEIIATLGPASQAEQIWRGMLAAEATAFRLNTSHLSLEQTLDWLERLSGFFRSLGTSLPVVLDLQGSKWRVGQFEELELTAGQTIPLILADQAGPREGLPVPHADFFRAAQGASQVILLNDAKLRLEVQSIRDQSLVAKVVQGGRISAHKGITFLESDYRVEAISAKDQAIIEQTRPWPWARYAISYVRDGQEMRRYRELVGTSAYLIAKLERGPAMADALEICQHADEVWVCRGDLGAELGLAGMARAVAGFTELLPQIRVPAIMAGQVLEHMAREPAPTRSEVCYLYDALAHGYAGFVLSDEAAIGQYPVESCQAAAMFRK